MGVYDDGVYGASGGGEASSRTYHNQTTDATPTPLTNDGSDTTTSTNIPTLADDTTLALTISLTGIKSDGSLNGHWEFKVTASRDGTVSLDNVAVTEYFNNLGVTVDSSWIQVDAVNHGVYVQVTGVAATTIEWVAVTGNASASSLTVNVTNNGISNPIGAIYYATQTVSFVDGGTSTLDASTHNVFSLDMSSMTGASSVAISNLPSSGNDYTFKLRLSLNAVFAITWFSGSTLQGMTPPQPSGTAEDFIVYGSSSDAGSTIQITVEYL